MPFPFSRKPAGLADDQPRGTREKSVALFFELLQVVAVSLAIIIPVRYFLVQPFYVKGASMEPNFYDHEYLIIDEISYRLGEPRRGDIVVFHYPQDPSQHFIKRVIGLPGETVEVKEGKVKVYNAEHPNGIAMDETGYLTQDFTAGSVTVTVKPEEYFLLGDNRAVSLDSRYFGPVKRSAIVGKVWVRGFPFDRWKHFDSIRYQEDQLQVMVPTSTSAEATTTTP